MDLDLSHDGGSLNGSNNWGGRISLPPFSNQFNPHYGQAFLGHGGSGEAAQLPFFIPSYLRKSRYIERLVEANKTRQVSRKDVTSTVSSNHGSLSTSSSSLNLHKMAPSHRGMTYDIIEKEPVLEDDGLVPLPTRWNESDKNPGIDLQVDGTEARFAGPTKSHDNEAAAVRADHPMSPRCGIYYYEVTILSRGKEGSVGVR
jgi:hypothetical protein